MNVAKCLNNHLPDWRKEGTLRILFRSFLSRINRSKKKIRTQLLTDCCLCKEERKLNRSCTLLIAFQIFGKK